MYQVLCNKNKTKQDPFYTYPISPNQNLVKEVLFISSQATNKETGAQRGLAICLGPQLVQDGSRIQNTVRGERDIGAYGVFPQVKGGCLHDGQESNY